MRNLARLLCLGLLVACVSCGGSNVPVVRDYTNGNPTHNVKPQSVIVPCPSGQRCGCQGPLIARPPMHPDCGLDPGYNVFDENDCNAIGGFYVSQWQNPYYEGIVECADSVNATVTVEEPEGCQGDVSVTWNPSGTTMAIIQPFGLPQRQFSISKGVRISYDCLLTADGILHEGYL